MKENLGWSIVKRFLHLGTPGFTFRDVKQEFPARNPRYLSRVLRDMIQRGELIRLSHDKYLIIPLDMDGEKYSPNFPEVVSTLMQHKEYYIGYGSALEIHRLSSQSDRQVYVISNVQMKPAIMRYGNFTIRYIHQAQRYFYGFNSMWICDRHKAMVSDLERTIFDACARPQYCGGITEVGRAIYRAMPRVDFNNLFYYFSSIRNISAIKRFLFLCDVLELAWTDDHEQMKDLIGSANTLLDPSAPDKGIGKRMYGLKINIDPDRIREEILNQ